MKILRSFPFVYWYHGSINNLDDLLKIGINEVEYLIIVGKETLSQEDHGLQDSETILSVQYLFRFLLYKELFFK